MKYRTQLYLSFLGIILCTTFVSLGILYWGVHHFLWKELQSKVLTAASTAAAGIDPEEIEEIQNAGGSEGPLFDKIVRRFIAIRDANRNDDIYILWIYTIRPSPENPKELEFGIDPDENNPDKYTFSRVPYPEGLQIGIEDHLGAPWVTPHLYIDEYGHFLSAFVPILNSSGKYVATLGVDVTAAFVAKDLAGVKILAWITIAITLAAGILAAAVLSIYVSRSLEMIAASVRQIGEGDFKARIRIDSQDEFGELAQAINEMAKSLEEHERLKLNFVRYVSKHVMEKILSSDVSGVLKGERKKLTVLFSDIRKFTSLSEKLPPEEVVSILNGYLEKMLNVVFSFNGTLDKFMGDGLLIEFGAPLDDPDQELNAVKTALGMQKALRDLCQEWAGKGRPQLKMGIGIHTGFAVVGSIGSEKRMEYTAVGDTIQTVFRLEDATKEFDLPILISETTAAKANRHFALKRLGKISMDGREGPIEVYAIEGEVW